MIEVNPLLPDDTWDWFCLDNVLYHGRILTIIWDKTGETYNRGQGLTVFADVTGLLGGMLMAAGMLDLNSSTFIERLTEALTLDSYLSGVGKAPVFAVIISTVGCFQGFRVYGSAESVGRQTTVSVVQSIFLVIIVDAVFSIAFARLGI